MSDDPQATPDPGNSAEPDAPDTNWEQRFKDTQGAYTKSQQELAAERAAWEDEDALLARVAEKFPHLVADEEEPDDDEPDDTEPTTPADPRVDVALGQLAEIQYERDLTRFLADRELSDKGRSVVDALCKSSGNNPKALEQAVETWFALADDFKPADDPKPKPKAPHVLTGGKAATDAKDFSQMSRDEINRHMVERARTLESQT